MTSWYPLAIYSQVFTNNVFSVIELVSSIEGLSFSRKSKMLAQFDSAFMKRQTDHERKCKRATCSRMSHISVTSDTKNRLRKEALRSLILGTQIRINLLFSCSKEQVLAA